MPRLNTLFLLGLVGVAGIFAATNASAYDTGYGYTSPQTYAGPAYNPPAPNPPGPTPPAAPPYNAPAYAPPYNATTPSVPAGAYLLIGIQPTVTAGDLMTFMTYYGLTMIDGPHQDGTYRVRVLSGTTPSDMMQSMRAQTNVVTFVMPN